MPAVINATVYAGEDVTLTLYARDRSNLPVSLSAGTISWRVGRGQLALDSTTPSFTVSGAVVSAAAGSFTVTLSPETTQAMEGDYQHEAWLTNASAQVTVVANGRLRVLPYMTA